MTELIRGRHDTTLTGVTTSSVGFPALGVIVLTLLLLTPLLAGAANGVQSLESIRDAARVYAEGQLLSPGQRGQVTIGRLDPRLRLRQCSLPLETFQHQTNRQGGRTTIGVRCADQAPWTIYVSAQVDSFVEVYTVGRTLSRGERLREADLSLLEVNVGTLGHGYFTEADQVVGMELRRPARSGEVLTPAMITLPELVRRGQTVTVLASSGSAQVSMRGEAMEGGAMGDRIRVRNVQSQRVIEGEIIGDGRVRVRL
ncbi:flagella basal body P-ring formation protein FlgA [Natronocella acetinitrilica]|uniref:Flagella basal body P-ring formation protein FlgA n=1 Tax=Natronocella acetinitrilica TaxID=414046 RepID=A0AAE3G894_9GAMM|nr:flagella basal body P-ring formation protein FlgA [Natronocella acetinitrilica]